MCASTTYRAAAFAANSERAYDLVAIDVDGTLLDSRHQLSRGAQKAIRALREQGTYVTLVTGRGKLATEQLMHLLELDQPYVVSGGACIVEPTSGKVLYYCPLASGHVEAIAQLARGADLSLLYEDADYVICDGPPALIEELIRIVSIPIATAPAYAWKTVRPAKMTIIGKHEILAGVERTIVRRHLPLHLTYSEPVYLEITREGVNKGAALRRLATRLGIPLARIAVIGDSRNDISMFVHAGLAVAMGNAGADVKAAAHVVAPTNDEGGVAWAISELMRTARPATAEARAPAVGTMDEPRCSP